MMSSMSTPRLAFGGVSVIARSKATKQSSSTAYSLWIASLRSQ
jgi:hypothetical protein